MKMSLLMCCLLVGIWSNWSIYAQNSVSGLQLPASAKGFCLQSEGLELWKVCNELSMFFSRNIVVYNDVKDTKISCSFVDLSLEKSLDLIAWLTGVEWYEKDGVYFFGGNKDYIEVLDNTGIDKTITGVFGQSNVKLVEDKIVITGTEREVKRIAEAIRKLQTKKLITLRIWGYEVVEESALKLGIDIDKSIKYASSWENIISNGYNPVQSLAVSLAMSVEAERSSDDVKLVLDTQLTCISGKTQKITVGEVVDREVYTTNEFGRRFVSGYNTLQTGYILNLSAYFYDAQDWLFNVHVENTAESGVNRRNRLLLNNTVILRFGPSLIGRIIKDSESEQISKGIPFLCDIPYIGYLFRVTEERKVRRHVLFFIERVEGVAVAGATAPPKAMPETRLIKIAEKIESVDLRKLGQGGKVSDKSPAPNSK